jgi:hypothetical protein
MTASAVASKYVDTIPKSNVLIDESVHRSLPGHGVALAVIVEIFQALEVSLRICPFFFRTRFQNVNLHAHNA